MSEPIFAQPERRSFGLPILFALAFAAVAIGLGIYLYPATSVHAVHEKTVILPTHTVFKSDSIVVGPPQASDVLFAVSTVKVENTTMVPVTLDNFSCTFTDPTGAVLTVKAATDEDLANEETSFPALKKLVGSALKRDASIAPGASAEGSLVFSFPFTREQWEARKAATVQVDIYHGESITLEIAKP